MRRHASGGPVGGHHKPAPINLGDLTSGALGEFGLPKSPLSRLVQEREHGGGCATPTGGPTPRAMSPVHGSSHPHGVAALPPRYPGSGQQSQCQHQQHNDPNYVGVYAKPTGYRVQNAPGGKSSLSLGWDESASAGGGGGGCRGRSAASPAGSGGRIPSYDPSQGYQSSSRAPSQGRSDYSGGGSSSNIIVGGGPGCRAPSPHMLASAHQRNSGGGSLGVGQSYRSESPLARRGIGMRDNSPGGRLGMHQHSHSAVQGPPVNASSYGAGGHYGAPAPPACNAGGPYGSRANYGAPHSRQVEATGLTFGARASDGRSSNSYANGGNQNCGNVVTDRRTTRVAQPPGGGSSIMFG